jgi:hypothetical protein
LNPADYGLPSTEAGKTISRVVNNRYPAYLSGFEIDWQTHLWYLPGALQGLVLNVNFTRTFSETKYPRTEIKTRYLTVPPWVMTSNLDTFFVDRLMDQPSNILNVTLGYDYHDLSARLSFLYQDDVFRQDHFYSRLRGTSDRYMRWDLSVKLKLPVAGMELMGTVSNISGSIERDLNVGTGYPKREQHYGFVTDIALRYRL